MSQTRSPRLAFSRLALVLLVLVLPARTTLAASGDLDPTFGAGGIVITDITDNSSETAYAVVVQSDGRIIAGGGVTSGAKTDFALLRYNVDGTADTSFGLNGVVTTTISAGADTIRAMVLQPDGALVTTGSSGSKVAVARYVSPTGALDPGFGAGGVVTTTIGASAAPQAVALDSLGRIVVAGTANGHFFVARYTTAGALDTTFNSVGTATASIGASDWGQGVAVQTDNKIIVAGYSDLGPSENYALLRFNISGTLDTTFNVTGKVNTDIGSNTNDQAHALAIQPDGKIVVAGFSTSGGQSFATLRYNANGSLDTSFGVSGRITTTVGAVNEAHALAIQPTGKIVVAGDTGSGGNVNFALVRYTKNGALDTTFNSGGAIPGIVTTDLAGGSDDLLYGLAIQPDNQIVVAGSIDQGGASAVDVAIARYDSPVAPPSVTDFGKTLLEDHALTFSAADFTSHFSDPDNNSLAAVKITVLPANGTLKLAGASVAADQVIAAASVVSLTFTPDQDWNGNTSLAWNGSNGLVYAPLDAALDLTVTAINDAPAFVKGGNLIVLENGGAHALPAWATGISAGPADEAGQALAFTVATNNPALFTAMPTVDAISGDFAFSSSPNVFGSAIVTTTLFDDGGIADGGVNTSGPQTITINVLFVNQAPSFTVGPDQTVLENGGPQTVTAWATGISAGPANETSQVLTFTAATDNDALFSALPVVNSTNGRLTFTPAPNVFGSTIVSVTLRDSGGTANGGADTSITQTFRITITFVNQAPTFIAGGDQTVQAGSGPQTVSAWAGSISPGPASEAGQALTFTVQTGNGGLFAALPIIDSASGDLTYAPGLHAWGSATVTVTLTDSGGTANGGVNASAQAVFRIVVQPYRVFMPIARR